MERARANWEARDWPSLVGQCRSACDDMLKDFPELTLRGGWVRTPLGYDVHYWLVTEGGDIVDPSEAQFGFLAREDYEDAGSTDPMVLLERFLVRSR